MTRHGLTALATLATGLAIAGLASASTTHVRLDVMTGDPNDPNAPIPLVEATGGSTINYAITAIVCTDANDLTSDANITKGLGAAYVTLNTDFGVYRVWVSVGGSGTGTNVMKITLEDPRAGALGHQRVLWRSVAPTGLCGIRIGRIPRTSSWATINRP
jgi:hypothetical protein